MKVGSESINLITVWSGAFLEKLVVPELVKKFTSFYGHEGALLYLQQHASCFYPEQDPPILFL
jgi:hypothetical protein